MVFRHNTEIGQNFLRDRSIVEWMVKRAALGRGDRVLEIGPGRGILTRGLLGTECDSLDVLELDTRLKDVLEPIAESDGRLFLHWGDAVSFDYAALQGAPTHIVANLPYHITTPLVWRFLESFVGGTLSYMLLMVQKEAAERLASGSASRESNPLGITLSALGEVKIVRSVPRSAFVPAPHVDSAIVEIRLSGERGRLPLDRAWRRLLSGSFAQRRKTLINNWGASFGLSRASASEILASHALPPLSRPEELALGKWLALYDDEEMERRVLCAPMREGSR